MHVCIEGIERYRVILIQFPRFQGGSDMYPEASSHRLSLNNILNKTDESKYDTIKHGPKNSTTENVFPNIPSAR
jgi:hypothetical protein